ncbi:MAG: HEPN domain-containing protein [Deltaproteobacteria bacterium]|nr:HEPN domain-containing protein [Deltaproteobacteria bacterium]
MKPGRDAGLRWLRQAEHDLKIAKSHQRQGDYSDACFMAEQASQKALKAFLTVRQLRGSAAGRLRRRQAPQVRASLRHLEGPQGARSFFCRASISPLHAAFSRKNRIDPG